MNRIKFLLLTIFLLGAFLRLFLITEFPVGFTPDEAAQGYTAYSILKTGKDEWGVPFPLFPRSFGDFKPPLYSYLLIPSVTVFGLNEFAVRFPAALFGSLSVLVIYFLTKGLLKDKRVSLIASFLLAISPWHIQLSRWGFEGSILALLIPLGLWLFLKGIKKTIWLILSAIPFGLSLFTYHPAKLFIPLLVLGLFIWRLEDLRRLKKQTVFFVLVLVAFFLILIFGLLQGAGARVFDIMITNPTGGWGEVSDRRFEAVKLGVPDQVARIFNNKLTYTAEVFVKNYLQYFSLEFLFTQGPAEGFYGMIPGRGILYLFELPLIIYALYRVFRGSDKTGFFLLFCLLISPIPAAFSKGPGYAANRAIIMIPFICMLSAWGLIGLIDKFRRHRHLKSILVSFILLVTVSFAFFLEDYLIHSPLVISGQMQYGWRQAGQILEKIEDNYSKIVVSRQLSEPQIYVAFYRKYPPKELQRYSPDWLEYQRAGLLFVDQLGKYSLGKYAFRNLHFPVDKELKNTLLVGKPQEFPEKINSIAIVNFPNGKPAFVLVDPEKI